MDQETENEAIDIESIDESACSASSLLEESSKDTSLWQGTVTHLDDCDIPDDIDAESKMLIKKMLEEERKYVMGRRKQKYPQKVAVKLPTKRKEEKFSHNKRWTEEERKLFHEAKMQYGHRWSKIAEVMGTRTGQQVKSFYRYSLQKERAENAALKCENVKTKKDDIKDSPLKSDLLANETQSQPKSDLLANEVQSQPKSDLLANEVQSQPKSDLLANEVQSQPKSDLLAKEIKSHPVTPKVNSGEQVNIKSGTESDEDEDVDILNDSGEESLPERFDLSSARQSDDDFEHTGVYGLTVNNNNESIICKRDGVPNMTKDLRVLIERSEDCARILESEKLIETNQFSCSIHKQSAISPKEGHALQSTEDEDHHKYSQEPGNRLPVGVSETVSVDQDSKNEEREKGESTDKKIPRPKLSCSSIIKPTKEPNLDINTVTEEEKLKFCSNATKGIACDPEKYLYIRNLILDKWNELRPKCLTKSLAKGLTRTCDVELMESIRHYLDQIGAINFTPPEDVPVDISSVSEEEKNLHPEFFLPIDKPRNRTPDKYMKIRNFYIDTWEANKPRYVPKTLIRGAFKNCGDVNTHASIHDALERLGLINVGVANPYGYRCMPKRRKKDTAESNSGSDSQENVRRSQRSRQKPEREEKLPKRGKKGPKPKYDPFKLLECFHFTETNPAPFSVCAESDAVALMDLHAHLSSTEVIGLLGGCYQESINKLSIQVAKPCRSLSTGMQCEMDPVSQTEAYESIMSGGHQVVGWYHSHPAFLPNPSVRDIETQSEFQGWFSQGGAPFVGMIVSPYHRIKDNISMINCLIVRQTETPMGMEDRPFQFEFSTNSENADPLKLLKSAEELMDMFKGYSLRVKMDASYTSKCTYIEKTIFSVCSHYHSDGHKELIRGKLGNILLSSGKSDESEMRLLSQESDTTGNDHG